MELDRNNLQTWTVQQKPCLTCPFAGETPLILSESALVAYYENLLGNGQHFCHSTNNQKICRGGRDIQLRYLMAMGYLDEPTDAAFDAEIAKYNQ